MQHILNLLLIYKTEEEKTHLLTKLWKIKVKLLGVKVYFQWLPIQLYILRI